MGTSKPTERETERPVWYNLSFSQHDWRKVKAKAALEGKTIREYMHDVVVADAMVMGFTARPSVEIVRGTNEERG